MEKNLARICEDSAVTEAYFKSKKKSFYKHGIENLEKGWNDCIALEAEHVDN